MLQKIFSSLDFNSIIYTSFGFFLGFLGNLITQWIGRKRLQKDFVKGLYAQFKEELPRLVGTYYIMCSTVGKVDRDVLNWMKSMTRDMTEYPQSYKDGFEELLRKDDADLALALKVGSSSERPKFVKKFSFPFLENNISSIKLLNLNLQQGVFKIWTKLNVLNEEIERNDFYFKKTFEQVTPENYDIIVKNTKESYANIGTLCREASELISKLIEKIEKE